MKHMLHRIRHDAGLMALALLAGAVLVIETALAFWGPQSTLIREYRQVLARARIGPAPDLLIMGDSVARGSILTRVLREQLGADVSIRNDAMQGTGPETAYFALKRLVAAGRVPPAVLYAPSPHTFASTRMHIVAGGLCTWPEVVDLLGSGHDRMDILGSTLLRFSYTLRYREQIAELLKGRRDVLASFRPPVLDEDEWMATCEKERAQRQPAAVNQQTLKPIFRTPFSVAPVNRHYLDRFLILAAQHGIHVYWATPPCTQRGYESREQIGFNTGYYSFLDQLATHPQVTVLQREFPVYPDSDSFDQTHFGIPASRQFSAGLGQRLRAVWPAAPTVAPASGP